MAAVSKFNRILLLIGIFFIAANLRAPITGLAPVLDLIIDHFTLTATQAGMLTTLPLIAFAVASPLASAMANRIGLELSLFIALVLITLGVSSRWIDSSQWLFIGTATIGVGIAIGNVLLPSVVKRDFPLKVAALTSAYVLAMGIFSGAYSAITLPLSEYKGMGWQAAIAGFSIFSIVSVLLWIPQLRLRARSASEAVTGGSAKVWNSSLAWQITILLGFNSFFVYIMIGWLPSILSDVGYNPAESGVMYGAFQAASAIPGVVLIPLLSRLRDQRVLTASFAIVASSGSLGLLILPEFAMLWSIVLGFFSGSVFILGLSFISLRTNNTQQATSLSGMVQSIGYSLAALGPILAGFMHTHFMNWHAVLLMCASASIVCAVVGLFCGRNITIDDMRAQKQLAI